MRSFLQRLRDDDPSLEVDVFNSEPREDLKSELRMLLSSRPLYINMEDAPLVSDSVLNYGVSYYLYTDLTEEYSAVVNTEISERILKALQRYEQRLVEPFVECHFSDGNYSMFLVTAMFFKDKIKFLIKWDKNSGEFSLYE